MIRITDKSRCIGCTSCMTACPVQCIVMRRDRQGFDYPVANPDICISCGKCESVCPVINPHEEKTPLAAFAVRVPEYVSGSSSGGVFPYLAGKVIEDGGCVFGAAMQSDMTVGHTDVSDLQGLESLRGSKYVQSDMYSAYQEVKDVLEDGRKVLFSGTPCQVAGLHSFLGKRYEGLMTVDVACHGVPSPGLWEKYIEALKDKYGGRVTGVCFRDKSKSWRHYEFRVDTVGKSISVPYTDDPYMALFIQDMTLRPSCYSCPAGAGKSASDVTLADLWNIAGTGLPLNDDKGVSLVLANTEDGLRALEGMDLYKTDYEIASAGNGGFEPVKEIPPRREEFFQGYHSARDLMAYMKGFVIRKPWYMRIYRKMRSCLSDFKRRISR